MADDKTAAEHGQTDVMIAWDDGHGIVVAVSSQPLPGWTVTGSEDVFESIDAIIERFPTAVSWRLLKEAVEPAVRRVTPDRETLAAAIIDIEQPERNALTKPDDALTMIRTDPGFFICRRALAKADALLASGVLGEVQP